MPGTSNTAVDQATAGNDQAASAITDADVSRAAAEAMSRLAGKAPEQTPAPEPTATQEPAQGEPTDQTPPEPTATDEPAGEPTSDPPATEPAKDPVPTADDDDHKERTRLGRKVAKLEDTLSAVLKQNEELIGVLKGQIQPKVQPEPQAEEMLDLNDPAQLDRFLTQREEQRARNAQESVIQYQRGYLTELNGWMEKAEETGEADAKDVRALLTKEGPDAIFNVRYSNDPKADFERNLYKAQAHFWKQKAAKPAAEARPNPLKNDKPKAPLGVAGESKTDAPKGPPSLSISPAAKAYAEKMGMTEDDMRAALSSPVPAHFNRGNIR